MRLDPADDREPFPGQTLRTVKNENGILFSGHHLLLRYLLCDPDVCDWKDLFRGAVIRLQSRAFPGIFYRHPGNTDRDEAHDNYVAIAGLSAVMGFEFHEQVLRHGQAFWWCYNSVAPKKFSLRHVRQPGEIAYYYACNRKRMPALGFLGFLGGIIVNAKQPRNSKHNNPSTSLLAFFRLSVMNELKGWQPRPYQWALKKAENYWFKSIRKKYGSIAEVYAAYFGEPNHPLRELSKSLTESKRESNV